MLEKLWGSRQVKVLEGRKTVEFDFVTRDPYTSKHSLRSLVRTIFGCPTPVRCTPYFPFPFQVPFQRGDKKRQNRAEDKKSQAKKKEEDYGMSK